MQSLRTVVSLPFTVLLMLACWWTLRLAWADHLARGRAADVLRAIRIAPGDAQNYITWVSLYDQPGRNPEDAVWALKEAAALDPAMSAVWIELGLRAETRGDLREAESDLARAARVDGMWRPRWTLANYYYRRGNTAKLLEWTRKALEVADVRALNPDPLFQLCWDLSGDSAAIWSQAVPAIKPVRARYLAFLAGGNRLNDAAPAAESVLAAPSESDIPVLLDYCDRLLEARDANGALRVWNELCSAKLVPYQRLDPRHGLLLTNGDFSAPPLSHGFDWRVPSVSGVSPARLQAPAGMQFEFDGEQPEKCTLLQQTVPVLPNRRYVLRSRYRASGIPAKSGLAWRVAGIDGGEMGGESSESSFEFSAGPSQNLANLELVYNRPPGMTRFAGSILILGVELRPPE